MPSSSKGGGPKRERRWKSKVAVSSFLFLRERKLLSRIVGDPTVSSRRDEKESCSTQRGLRVGTGFKEFRQTL